MKSGIERVRRADPISAEEIAGWSRANPTPPPTEAVRGAGEWLGPTTRPPKTRRAMLYVAIAASILVIGGLAAARSTSTDVTATDQRGEEGEQVSSRQNDPEPTETSVSSTTAGPAATTLQDLLDAHPDVFLGSYTDAGRLVLVVGTGSDERATELLRAVDGPPYVLKDCDMSAEELHALRDRVADHLAGMASSHATSFDGASCRLHVLVAGLTDAQLTEARSASGERVVIAPVENMSRD